MQFRIFSIPATGSPDLEEELNRFLRSHRVVTTQKTLQAVDGVLRWCFCIEFLDGAPPPTGKPSGRTERIDYKEVLPPDDFVLFAKLRDLRKELAAPDAVPVYTVCTNEQLAEMASKRPTPPNPRCPENPSRGRAAARVNTSQTPAREWRQTCNCP